MRRVFKKNIFFLCCILLVACNERKKTNIVKKESTPSNVVAAKDSTNLNLTQLDTLPIVYTMVSDSIFDSIKHHEFNYSSVSLSPIEKSMAEAGLVDVLDVIPSIKIDLRYATSNNFVGEILYPSVTRCFLRIETILKLLKANNYLHQLKPQYTFIIFDGARPQSVQYKMYEIVKAKGQTKYVASPAKGSLHNFGTAIDLSLYDLEENIEVDMGTEFDFFGPEAQPRFQTEMLKSGKLTEAQVANRNLLKKVMKQGGFHAIQTEWWHFETFDKNFVRSNYKIIP